MRKTPPDWLLGLLLILGVYLWQRTAFPLWMVDLFPNQLGAYFWKTGELEWMYTPVAKNAEWVIHRAPVAERLDAEGDPNTFQYPPFVAAALSPLTDFSAIYWRNVLFGINIFLIFVIAYQVLALSGAEISWRAYLWSLALVLLMYPLARAIKLSQIVPLLSVMLWGGMIWMRKQKACAAGTMLGLVSAIKLFPFGLVLLPVLHKRFKLALIWIGTVIGIYVLSVLTLGMRVHQYWWEVMNEFRGLVQPFFGNQAPLGWITRVFYQRGWIEVIPFTTPLLDFLRIASALIFGGITVYVLWKVRNRLSEENLVISSGLLFAGIHLAMPVMWEHYWIFLLPSLGWAIRETWLKGDRRFWEIWFAVAVFFFTMKLTRLYGDSDFGRIMTGSQTLGMLLLWIWFIRRTLKIERKEPTLSAVTV